MLYGKWMWSYSKEDKRYKCSLLIMDNAVFFLWNIEDGKYSVDCFMQLDNTWIHMKRIWGLNWGSPIKYPCWQFNLNVCVNSSDLLMKHGRGEVWSVLQITIYFCFKWHFGRYIFRKLNFRWLGGYFKWGHVVVVFKSVQVKNWWKNSLNLIYSVWEGNNFIF